MLFSGTRVALRSEKMKINRIEPLPSAAKSWNPNHWATRVFPRVGFLSFSFFFKYLFILAVPGLSCGIQDL